MIPRCILAFVPGVEEVLPALMPQRSLATMAGALLDTGYETRILDFGVPQTLHPFVDSKYTQAASEAYQQDSTSIWSPRRYRHLKRTFLKAQDQRRAWILNKLMEAAPADSVVFLVHGRADLCETLVIAESLKQRDLEMRIFATGPYIEQCGDVILSHCGVFDALLLPDAEVTLPQLAEKLHHPDHWQDLPNLLLPRESGVFHTPRACRTLDSNAKPCYATSAYPAIQHKNKWMYFSLEPSRGIHHLTFSDAAALWRSHHLRLRKAEQSAAEAEAIAREHHAHAFHIDGYAAPGDHLRKTAIALQQQGRPYRFSLAASFAQLQPEHIPALDACGGLSMGFRMPSGSQRLLQDYYGEDFSVTPMEAILRAAQSAGMARALTLTYPCPEEDRHTTAETLRILLRNQPESIVMRPALPGPGARWTQTPKQFGFQIHPARYNQWLAGRINYFPLEDSARASGVRMRNKRSGTIRNERMALIRELQRQDLLYQGDERLLLASRLLAGDEGWRSAFQALDQALRTLDAGKIASYMEQFNNRTVIKGTTLQFSRFLPTMAAVGN